MPLGFPANDRLFDKTDLFGNGFYPALCTAKPQKPFSKIIGWLPTFRQHRQGGRIDSEKVFPFGVPLVQTEEELVQLNQFLSEKNILLAIQMHHAQAANFSKQAFSNIVLISQDLKYKMGVSTANLMQSFDALITDYSAAYHEYIMLNRPIALTIDDFEEYSSKTGFLFDYFEWIKGEYLKTTSDLMRFIDIALITREVQNHKPARRVVQQMLEGIPHFQDSNGTLAEEREPVFDFRHLHIQGNPHDLRRDGRMRVTGTVEAPRTSLGEVIVINLYRQLVVTAERSG